MNMKFILSLGCLLVALFTGSVNASGSKKISPLDVPFGSCGSATDSSINIVVCAGPSGAPAGFSVQWTTLANFIANGSVWPLDETQFCAGSFSGNANASRYNLLANECTSINIGELLFDNGASANCIDSLQCGTDYVFRIFCHATSVYPKSAWCGTFVCSTLPCTPADPGCTLTQGYWKTHNPTVCDATPDSPLCVQWPVNSLTLGNNVYNISQLLAILNTPAQGNGLLTLAHQLIAAKLNIANGADDSAIASVVAAADATIGNLVVGTDFLSAGSTSALVTDLTNYNEGATGPGHCN
jgi:hypothetical protein